MNAASLILFATCIFQFNIYVLGLKCFGKYQCSGESDTNCPKGQKTCQSGCAVEVGGKAIREFDCGVPNPNQPTCVDPKDGIFNTFCICNTDLCNTIELSKGGGTGGGTGSGSGGTTDSGGGGSTKDTTEKKVDDGGSAITVFVSSTCFMISIFMAFKSIM